jgi:signal transduction histidine kinase
VFSPLGALVEAVSTHVDVTERKRAQHEHERLRQLESDLARMNRLSMMGELTASLAHEITQPIAAARNNARAAQNFLDKRPPDLDESGKHSAASSGMPTAPETSSTGSAIRSKKRLRERSALILTKRSMR